MDVFAPVTVAKVTACAEPAAVRSAAQVARVARPLTFVMFCHPSLSASGLSVDRDNLHSKVKPPRKGPIWRDGCQIDETGAIVVLSRACGAEATGQNRASAYRDSGPGRPRLTPTEGSRRMAKTSIWMPPVLGLALVIGAALGAA